jgi:very-short-patch-repair endonuclease
MAHAAMNRSDMTSVRRKLRRTETPTEKFFWNAVRDRRIANCKFRRQSSVEKFVVDFYASEVCLAIELDGAIHLTEEAKARDAARETLITQYGITFLRFTNDEVEKNLPNVLETVSQKVRELRAVLQTKK